MSKIARRQQLVDEANSRLLLPVPEFALTARDEIIDRLMREPELVDYIEASAAQQVGEKEELVAKARQFAAEIGPRFSLFFYFRLGYFLARTLIRLHFRVRAYSVHDAALRAIPSTATVILVSNHRSNFDPLVITYLASKRSTIALSAGEWARLWPLHHLVRAGGGFVVDRTANDPLYRQVLAAYVRLSAAAGLHQAFFPEGELSRDGKMSAPKLGFLNYYCRACSEDRDIVFVPVGINYDRIPEDRRLVRSTGGFENPRTTFLVGSSLRYLLSVLTMPFRRREHRYGHACVAFEAPLSLHAWLRDHDIAISELKKPDRYTWLPGFAADLMQRCAQQIPAPPVVLVAYVICDGAEQQLWSVDALKKAVAGLAERLAAIGRKPFTVDDIEDPVSFALEMLMHNKLVHRDRHGNYLASKTERPVLEYYADSIAHLLS
ncbi:MAG: 1-acyl-sn-glycerol-3-phosphate acyltransferase [Woeseiaceae bacterium]